MSSALAMGAHVKSRTMGGFTLTEIAIVLGIIGTILGAIWVAASRVNANNRAQKASGQVIQILSGYQSLYSQHNVDTGGDITCMGVNAGFFPSDMLPPGTTCVASDFGTYPQTPWGGGGEVEVTADQTDNGIQIGYYDIPQSACILLATAEANAPNIIHSYVGTARTSPNEMTYPPYGNAIPMTSTQISSFCQPSNNEVTFDYTAN